MSKFTERFISGLGTDQAVRLALESPDHREESSPLPSALCAQHLGGGRCIRKLGHLGRHIFPPLPDLPVLSKGFDGQPEVLRELLLKDPSIKDKIIGIAVDSVEK